MSESKNKIVLFKSSDGVVSLPVEFGKDTAWLTQAQMAQLFGKEAVTKPVSAAPSPPIFD